jgi:hypothetical protein
MKLILKKGLCLKQENEKFLVFSCGNLLFSQIILKSRSSCLTDVMYTYLYVCKVLSRFGFIAPISLNFGFKRKKS